MGTPQDRPSPFALSLLMAPFGVLVAFFGWWLGRTGTLSRSGSTVRFDPPWDWIIGGGFLALGVLILMTPAYYYFRGKR